MKNIVLLIAVVSTSVFGANSYTGEALSIQKYLEGLFQASRKVNSSDASEKSTSRKQIETALDWDRVSMDCLGKNNAKKRTASELAKFRDMLKEVVLKTAFSRMDTFWDGTTFEFEKIDVKGTQAHTVAKFVIKQDAFSLEYYLTKRASRWWITDIAYEELRYSVNINEQIDAFLKEKSFNALLDKLKKRREELDTDTKKS